jgi:hypothetical protein
MTPSIERAVIELKAATKKLKQTVATCQKRCKHAHIAECEYIPSKGYGAFAPIRICLSCGMTEDGWGCGYLVLRGNAEKIERDKLYELRQGLRITEEHKGPLLRKELTVLDYINGTKTGE